MLKKRLIIVLTLVNGSLYGTRNFKPDHLYSYDFVDTWDIDEIILLNIGKKDNDDLIFLNTLKDFSNKCFVPITVGGKINNLQKAEQIFKNGADKISINTALKDKKLVEDFVRNFGSSSIVGSVDLKKKNDKDFIFSHNDEKWITGLPRNIWDYFEGRWRGNIVDISFTELIDGLSKFEGQLVPELDHLCETGNISIAHDLAFSQSNSQDGNAVFVFAVHSTRNLIDTKTTKEGYAFLDENFIRALKVYLYAYQNLMSPALLLAMAERHLISEREKRE